MTDSFLCRMHSTSIPTGISAMQQQTNAPAWERLKCSCLSFGKKGFPLPSSASTGHSLTSLSASCTEGNGNQIRESASAGSLIICLFFSYAYACASRMPALMQRTLSGRFFSFSPSCAARLRRFSHMKQAFPLSMQQAQSHKSKLSYPFLMPAPALPLLLSSAPVLQPLGKAHQAASGLRHSVLHSSDRKHPLPSGMPSLHGCCLP